MSSADKEFKITAGDKGYVPWQSVCTTMSKALCQWGNMCHHLLQPLVMKVMFGALAVHHYGNEGYHLWCLGESYRSYL